MTLIKWTCWLLHLWCVIWKILPVIWRFLLKETEITNRVTLKSQQIKVYLRSPFVIRWSFVRRALGLNCIEVVSRDTTTNITCDLRNDIPNYSLDIVWKTWWWQCVLLFLKVILNSSKFLGPTLTQQMLFLC